MFVIIMIAFLVLGGVGFVWSLMKGFAKWFLIAFVSVTLVSTLIYFLNAGVDNITTHTPNRGVTQTTDSEPEVPGAPDHFVEKLSRVEGSNAREEAGAEQWGATLIYGEVDAKGRATWAHIRLSEDQAPGQNGQKRPPKITTDPVGWKNYHVEKKFWAYDRTHLVGYQFSGVNNEVRNLTIGTGYLNRGVEKTGGMDQGNEDGMLFYEQRLDSWLALHPNYDLDYYVKAIYEGENVVPSKIYMQWVGVDENNQTIPIQIDGKSKNLYEDYWGVTLDNVSPSYTINYETAEATW